MDATKVNALKFLMTMFENSYENVNGVKIFKLNVEELVRRHQISPEVQSLVYNIYGISNTDTFKPNSQENKLMQINWLMLEADRRFVVSGPKSSVASFKQMIDDGVKAGVILKTVKEIIYNIFDLDSTKTKSATIGAINTNRPPLVDTGLKSTSKKSSVFKSKEVLADIDKFKPEYLLNICYEYINPSYDGCSGSSKYLHIKLIDAMEKPIGARIQYYTEIYNDGCHSRYGYVDVPTKCCKPKPKPPAPKPPISKPPIVTPYTDISTGCTRSGETRRC